VSTSTLRASGGRVREGSRRWPWAEIAIVRRIVRLVGAGFALDTAAVLARELTPGVPYEFGEGVTVTLSYEALYEQAAAADE